MTTEGEHEERVRTAVIEALERMPGPDRGRLARIEQRLLARRKRRRPVHPWWWVLVGAGLAASAAAAYWGLHATGDDPEEREQPSMESSREMAEPARRGDAPEGDEETGDGQGVQEDDDPVIYIGQ